MRFTIVLLPEPVPPMIAVVFPGRAVNDSPWSTGRSLCGYAKSMLASSTTPVGAGSTGLAGSAIDDVVSRTSTVRC